MAGVLCVAEVELWLVFCVLQRQSCDWCFVCCRGGVVTGVLCVAGAEL